MNRKLRQVKGNVRIVETGLGELDKLHGDSKGMLQAAQNALSAAKASYSNITNTRLAIKNSSLALEHQEGILYGLNPRYQNQYVSPAQAHAEALKRLVLDYQRYVVIFIVYINTWISKKSLGRT